MEIRRAEEKDIEGILKLLVQVNMVHHKGRPDIFNGTATKYTAEELAEILLDDRRPVFVYVSDDGEVLGHAFCVLHSSEDEHVLTDIKTLYIDDICVDEDLRGTSVGRAIFDHITAYAREKGCHNVTLNVWSCNPGAMSFYEKLGMTPYKIGMELIL